jgi:hypothetical protein
MALEKRAVKYDLLGERVIVYADANHARRGCSL